MFRASTGNVSNIDDGLAYGERWDRDRFERMRARGGGGGGGGGRPEHDHFRFTEHDRFPGGRRDIDIHKDIDRRGPGPAPRVVERERFHEDDRLGRPARHRPEVFDEPTPSEVANRALAPYRRKSVVEKDLDVAIRRPTRPGYLRRQSSLDTFDRRPLPRYNDYEREEWRPPTNVEIPLPIRERRRSPRRPREDEFEEIRYREVEREREREREPRGRGAEEYREVEVRREKSRRRRSRSRAARSIAATSVRSSSTSSFEEVSPVRAPVGRKGKTRMPRRLVKKQAIIELGYPYEEEEDFIIVRRALDKEHIDEIIRISENYKEEKTTYVYQDNVTEIVEATPPPPPPSAHYQPAPPQSAHYAQSVRSASPSRHGHEVYEREVEESAHIGGPLTVLVPGRPVEHRNERLGDRDDSRYEERRHTEERRVTRVERDTRSERDIKEEIRALEAERRMLKYERDSDYEVIERERREPRRDVVRIEKDRKVRREPNPKLVAAMMATLT